MVGRKRRNPTSRPHRRGLARRMTLEAVEDMVEDMLPVIEVVDMQTRERAEEARDNAIAMDCQVDRR